LLEKAEKVKQIKGLIQEYESIGISSLHKVRASQLQEIRRKLEDEACIRAFKNLLVERAISESEGTPNIDKLKEYLGGPNLFVFTNLNPFKLILLLERGKVKAIAKAGDTCTEDTVIPAGNTGLPPGPVISQLGSVGIPTRIESGSVWVNQDTVVARKGEVISTSLAPVLSKLGIKSVELGLSLKVVYDNGVIIPEGELKLSLDEYRQNLSEAYMQALKLSLEAAYPMVENVSLLIQIAALEAHNLAFNASISLPETVKGLIRKAYFEATALSSEIRSIEKTEGKE
jgi:large subunit ribosomal protein L10